MTEKKPRQRTCKACKKKFTPTRTTQCVCSHECAFAYANALSAKKKRAETKERKERLKTRSDYMKEAQIAFNAYIRYRDKDKPCICCGLPLNSMGSVPSIGGGFDCGHYRSVGSAPHMRFHEDNAHGQRKQCNRWGSGRAVDYRIGLIKRIGLAAVERLESDNSVKKYTIEELKEIRQTYKHKLRDLQLAERNAFHNGDSYDKEQAMNFAQADLL